MKVEIKGITINIDDKSHALMTSKMNKLYDDNGCYECNQWCVFNEESNSMSLSCKRVVEHILSTEIDEKNRTHTIELFFDAWNIIDEKYMFNCSGFDKCDLEV